MDLEIPQHVMLKLKAWRDFGNTEVTGFFVSEKDNIEKIIDAHLVKASCTSVTVDMKPEDIAAFYERKIIEKIYPDQLQIWWHTHPGNSAHPSSTDQTTFAELGKDRTFNAMYILAKGGQEFAQLSVTDKKTQYMIKESMTISHPVGEWLDMPNYSTLKQEYYDMVIKRVVIQAAKPTTYTYNGYDYAGYDNPVSYNNASRPTQRELFEASKEIEKEKEIENIEIESEEDPNADIIDQLDTEFICAINYTEFIKITQDMIKYGEVTEDVLNQWFEDNKFNARCNRNTVTYGG